MWFGLTQNNMLGFYSFPPNKKKEKRPFLLLWPNPVLFLSIFQLSPWTEAAIIFPGLSRGNILCFVPPCHAVHGQTQSEQQSSAPSGQNEPSGASFLLHLNFHISESVLSRPPHSWISGASKMLNADKVFAWVCEAGSVRGICSYLIFFLTLSHCVALASPFAPMAQFPWLQSRNQLYHHSKVLCLLTGTLSWKQHINHCTVVQQNFFSSISASTEYWKVLMV